MGKNHFYAFLPLLHDQVGHVYTYHIAVEKAVKSLQWDYIALVPQNTPLSLTQNWKRVLPEDSWKKKKTSKKKISLFFRHFFSLKKEIHKMPPYSIFFLEHFEVFHMASLFFALFFSRKKLRLWILHRYVYRGKKKHFYTLLHFLFRFRLGEKNFQLFSDSELLQKGQEPHFKIPVTVLPIPHGNTHFTSKKRSSFLWWPGGSIRKEKGLFEIQQLSLELLQKKSSLKLLVAETAKPFLCKESYPFCQFIQEELTREEFSSFLQESSFILLPYDPTVYKEGTSGIFVESIIAGKIPVIKEGSWLAFEAKKLGISEVIIDWNKEILSQIETLSKNESLLVRLQKAQKLYENYHSIPSFASCLQKSFYKEVEARLVD